MPAAKLRHRLMEPFIVAQAGVAVIFSMLQYIVPMMEYKFNVTTTLPKFEISNSTIEFVDTLSEMCPSFYFYLFICIIFPIEACIFLTCLSFYASVCRMLNREAREFNVHCKQWMDDVKRGRVEPQFNEICAWHARLSYAVTCADDMFSTFAGTSISATIPVHVMVF
jgi:hypothetical protein